MASETLTLESRYTALRASLPPDVLIAIRVGDWYEFFKGEATLVRQALPDLSLTKRGEMPMVGIPYHRLDADIAKLVAAGHRVAVCEGIGQEMRLEGPKEKPDATLPAPGLPAPEMPEVGGSSANEEFHAVPRLSASGLARSEACPASFARDLEMHQFVNAHGLRGLPSTVAAIMGTKFHSLLAGVPYSSQFLGLSSDGKSIEAARPPLFEAIHQRADEVGLTPLSNADFWFCVNALKARNQILNHVLRAGAEIAQPIKEVQFNFDQRRMFVQYEPVVAGEQPVEFSGLPDVQVSIVDALGQHHAVIADYKSGYLDQPEGEINRQLTGLAALAAHDCERTHGQELASVHVITLSRADLCPPPDENGQRRPLRLARYGRAEIEAAKTFTRERTRETARAALPIQRHFAAGGNGRLPETVQNELHDKANVGKHCTHCDGKHCCTKFRASISEFSRSRLDKDTINHLKEAQAKISDKSMMPEDLHPHYTMLKSVVERADIFVKSLEQSGDLLRQMLAPGEGRQATPVRGISLKPGNRRFAVKVQKAEVEGGAEGILPEEGKESKAKALPPPTVFERIRKAVPGLTQERFFSEGCDVNATRTRELLSDLTGIPVGKVMEKLLDELENNPFELRPNKATIVAVSVRDLREMERQDAPAVADYLAAAEPVQEKVEPTMSM